MVIAIIAALIALLLPAVAKVREVALRIQSQNNLKQIVTATHHFADNYSGKLPSLDGSGVSAGDPLMFALLPYIEHGNYYAEVKAGLLPNSSNFTVRVYVSPADPSLPNGNNAPGLASYAANAQAFMRNADLSKHFTDGTSNTIAFGEHYAFNCAGLQFNWHAEVPIFFPNLGAGIHRATFADFDPKVSVYNPAWDDIYPVTSGSPPVSLGSIPELTFQVRPKLADCDPRVAQTPHTGGMLVALFDGSVRILSAGMSPSTYWAAVTPAGGEVLGDDW